MDYKNNNLDNRLKNYLDERNFYKKNNLKNCDLLKEKYSITRDDVIEINNYIKKKKSEKEQKKIYNDIFNHEVYKTVSNGMPLYPNNLFGLNTNIDNIEDLEKIQNNTFNYSNDNYCNSNSPYFTFKNNNTEYNKEELMVNMPNSTLKSYGYPNATNNYFNIVNKNSINLSTNFLDRPKSTRINNKEVYNKNKYNRDIM